MEIAPKKEPEKVYLFSLTDMALVALAPRVLKYFYPHWSIFYLDRLGDFLMIYFLPFLVMWVLLRRKGLNLRPKEPLLIAPLLLALLTWLLPLPTPLWKSSVVPFVESVSWSAFDPFKYNFFIMLRTMIPWMALLAIGVRYKILSVISPREFIAVTLVYGIGLDVLIYVCLLVGFVYASVGIQFVTFAGQWFLLYLPELLLYGCVMYLCRFPSYSQVPEKSA